MTMKKTITTLFLTFAVIGYLCAQGAWYEAVRKPAEPVIDTNTTEIDLIWDDVEMTMVENFASTDVAEDLDPESYHGEFRAMWDDANLYMVMDIKDIDPHPYPESGAQSWMNDGCEIFLQYDSLHEVGSSVNNAGDSYQQYRYNYERVGSDGPSVLASEFPVYYVQALYNQDYAFLVIIPWARIRANNDNTDSATVAGIVAEDIDTGKIVSLELSVMEAQEDNGRLGCMQWSNTMGTDEPYTNSTVWGYMKLIWGDLASGISTTTLAKDEFKIYPTFVDDMLNLVNAEGKLEIFDITGQLIRTINANETRVNVSSMKPGIYIVKDNLGRSVRFVKQ
jgi:hypothetical protein